MSERNQHPTDECFDCCKARVAELEQALAYHQRRDKEFIEQHDAMTVALDKLKVKVAELEKECERLNKGDELVSEFIREIVRALGKGDMPEQDCPLSAEWFNDAKLELIGQLESGKVDSERLKLVQEDTLVVIKMLRDYLEPDDEIEHGVAKLIEERDELKGQLQASEKALEIALKDAQARGYIMASAFSYKATAIRDLKNIINPPAGDGYE